MNLKWKVLFDLKILFGSVDKFFSCFLDRHTSNIFMLKRSYILILLFSAAYCQPSFKRSPSQFSGLFGIITAAALASANAVPAKYVTSDFMSGDSISPVVISKSQKLGIFMDKEMTVDCQISFNGTVQSSTVSLSSEKKVIFFTPSAAGWPVNLGTISYINFSNCKDAAGAAVASSGNGAPVYVADGAVYLDGTNGLDGNYTGMTTGDPLLSLNAALTAVTSNCTGACAILMKGGVYPIPSSITVPANVSFFGGYDPADWKKRRADRTSLAPYDTIIDDLSSNVTGLAADPYSSIKYSNYSGVKEKSVLDGLMVYGPFSANAGSYVSPIGTVSLQAGAGIIIRNTQSLDRINTISVISTGFSAVGNSGTIQIQNSKMTASYSAAASSERHGIVYSNSVAGSLLYITESELDSGVSSASSAGFRTAGAVFGNINLEKNIIRGGDVSANSSYGVYADFTTTNGMIIIGNTITSGNAGANSFGIHHLSGSGLVISGNTITSGSSGFTTAAIDKIASAGIKTVAGNSLTISNNTVISGNTTSSSNSPVTAGIGITAGAGISITGNKLTSGTNGGTVGLSAGIQMIGTASGISISQNNITSGMGANNSYGIESGANTTTISGNTVHSTICSASSCGVSAVKNNGNPSITISGNILTTGNCSASGCYNRVLDMAGGTNTTITGNTITGGNGHSHAYGIEANSGNFVIDSNTVIGGGCLNGSCSSRGISVSSGTSITLTKNNITAGTCQAASCDQKGLVLAASATSYTINENTVDSGTPSANTSSRIAFDLVNWPNNSDIQRNTFINRNGAGDPVGIDITSRSTSAKICSNVIIGGGSTNASAALSALRTSINAGGLKIMGNTIIAPVLNTNTAYGVNFSSGGAYSNLKLDQNIIYGHPSYIGSTTCIKESGTVTYSTLVRNNVSNCNNLYDDNNGTMRNFICTSGGPIGNFDGSSTSCGNQLTGVSATDNTNLNPVFVNFSGNDLHLDPSTPAGIRTVMAAPDITAFSTNCGNVLDRDGNTRTAGTSIGAYK